LLIANQKTKLDAFIVSRRWKRINQLDGDLRSVGTTIATIGNANGGRRIDEANKKWLIGDSAICRSERVMPNDDVRRPDTVAPAMIAGKVMATGKAR
jgi:hypothetical protein